MNLNRYMTDGIGHIMKTAGRFYVGSRQGRAFLAAILPRLSQSARLREENEAAGLHVPPFLIASIASGCNLHCAGCYARAGGACATAGEKKDLTAAEWDRIFAQAHALGVAFLLLAGGEPFTRRDVLQAAAKYEDMIFPIFTNGTLLGTHDLAMFDQHRNLIPVLSLEGDQAETDRRRGEGTYAKLGDAMLRLKEKRVLFGASVTVSKENIEAVRAPQFIQDLRERGCGLILFVEYVPAQQGTEHLALDRAAQATLLSAVQAHKARFRDTVILSFPADEEKLGGCLAAGRGFFHINPKGGAEPCPFSPYSVHSLRELSMRQVLGSEYFEELRAIAAQAGVHTGGCTLFARHEQVRALHSTAGVPF